MKQYVDVDNTIKIRVPQTEEEKKNKTESSNESTKKVKILMENSTFSN